MKIVNINSHKVVEEYDCDNVASTPFFYNDVVYFGSDDGHLYGVNDDGKKEFGKKLDGELKTSPIVVDDTIYIGSTNGKLYSIDTCTVQKYQCKKYRPTENCTVSIPTRVKTGNSQPVMRYCLPLHTLTKQ